MCIILFNMDVIFMYLIFCFGGMLSAHEPSRSCMNRFEYEYGVLQKILKLETTLSEQQNTIATLLNTIKDATEEINELRKGKKDISTTYIRWGRTVCPDRAPLVYHGYAAGSFYGHSGSGSNRLCLPTDPMWNQTVSGYQSAGRLFGSEYQVSEHPFWKHLHDRDVPCAVCRTEGSDVLMIPGRFECYDNYTSEYSGYLMSGYVGHNSSLDYICMDGEPEPLDGGESNLDGAILYLVETQCGSLRCPPYTGGHEVTCAVCSYKGVSTTTP